MNNETLSCVGAALLCMSLILFAANCGKRDIINNPVQHDTTEVVRPCEPETVFVKCPRGYECRPCKRKGDD